MYLVEGESPESYEELQQEQRKLVETLLERGDLEEESMRVNSLHRGTKE